MVREAKRSVWRRWAHAGRWLCFLLLACGALAVVSRQAWRAWLDRQIRTQIAACLAERYPDMLVRIDAARRIPGHGIEVLGLTLALRSPGEPVELAHIDELFCVCDTRLSALLSGVPCVEHFVVRRMTLHATRLADGSWTPARLFPLPHHSWRLPSAVIEDAQIKIRDLTKGPELLGTLRDIDIAVAPEAPDAAHPTSAGELRFNGTLVGEHFRRVRVEGSLDPRAGTLRAQGTLQDLDLSPRLRASLPEDLARYLTPLESFRARGELAFQVEYRHDVPNPLRFALTGQFAEGRLEDPRLPYPITDLSATVYWDNDRLRVEQLVGRSGATKVELDCDLVGWSHQPQGRVQVRAWQLPLDQRLYDVLPASLRDGWQKLDPRGVVHGTVTIDFHDGQPDADLVLDCVDVAFRFHRFPYPLDGGRGRIRYRRGVMTTDDMTARAAGQTVHLACQVAQPGPRAQGWITLRGDGAVPIDATLLAALSGHARAVVTSLHPEGALQLLSGRIDLPGVSGQPAATHFEVAIQNGSLQFERFPYPLSKIQGLLVIDGPGWELKHVSGNHGSGFVAGHASWTPAAAGTEGGILQINLVGTDVPLDEDLRDSVAVSRPDTQRFWSDLRPRGSVDYLAANVRYDSAGRKLTLDVQAQKWAPRQNVEGRSIRLQPAWFPYAWEDVTGTIRFRDGVLQLDGLRGRHGATTVQADGRCYLPPDGRWRVELDRLVADRVQADYDLRAALPPALGEAVGRLRPEGHVGIAGWLRVAGQPRRSAVTASWDVLVDMENGRLDAGVPLEHIRGSTRIRGTLTPQGTVCQGELDVDSLVCHGITITGIRGPMSFDATQVVLGSWTGNASRSEAPRQITARAVGGTLAASARLGLDAQHAFHVQGSLTDGDLREIALVAAPGHTGLSGKVFTLLDLQGTAAGPHTWRGGGRLRLREADIYRLPVMMALLRVASLKPPDTTAFTSSDMDFAVEGEQVRIRRIDFSGDVISLRGMGWMDIHRNLGLTFYTQVGHGNWNLPVLRSLLASASRSMLLIEVTGTVDQPLVTPRPLPELDDTLQRLFAEPGPLGGNISARAPGALPARR